MPKEIYRPLTGTSADFLLRGIVISVDQFIAHPIHLLETPLDLDLLYISPEKQPHPMGQNESGVDIRGESKGLCATCPDFESHHSGE